MHKFFYVRFFFLCCSLPFVRVSDVCFMYSCHISIIAIQKDVIYFCCCFCCCSFVLYFLNSESTNEHDIFLLTMQNNSRLLLLFKTIVSEREENVEKKNMKPKRSGSRKYVMLILISWFLKPFNYIIIEFHLVLCFECSFTMFQVSYITHSKQMTVKCELERQNDMCMHTLYDVKKKQNTTNEKQI